MPIEDTGKVQLRLREALRMMDGRLLVQDLVYNIMNNTPGNGQP
jgi:hypothetical protein